MIIVDTFQQASRVVLLCYRHKYLSHELGV